MASVQHVKAIHDIPLSSLVLEHEFFKNPRSDTGLDAKDIGDLADDIAKRGIKVPLIVVPVKGEDKDEIVHVVFDGQRRTLASREALPPSAKVPVSFLTDKPVALDWKKSDQFLLDILAVGLHRRGLSSYEISDVAERIKNRENKTLAELSTAVGRSESWLSRFLAARKTAHADTLKAWREGSLTDEQFLELATVAEEEQPQVVKEAEQILADGEASREARAEVRHKVKEKAAKAAQSKAKPGKSEPSHKTEAKSEAPKRVPPNKHELDAFLEMVEAKPPTDKTVKAIVMGVKYALGIVTPDTFGRAWNVYVSRATGAPIAKKAPKKKSGKGKKGGGK